MSRGTQVGSAFVIVIFAGTLMSMFGNYKSEPKTKEDKPSSRHVVIRFEHGNVPKNDMIVVWDFGPGNKRGSQTIDKIVTAFEVDQVVNVGTTVYGSASPAAGKVDPPEAFKTQILFDGKKQCPDHFFGKGVLAECRVVVA